MLSRRYCLALFASLSLALGAGCFGGPISDFPGKAEGDGTGNDGPDSKGPDAGGVNEDPGDGDNGAGDGDSGEVPGTLDGGSLDLDGGVPDGGPSDASVDAGDATTCPPGLVDAAF